MTKTLVAVALSVCVASCTLGPNYHRPEVVMPTAFRNSTPPQPQPGTESLADVRWFDLRVDFFAQMRPFDRISREQVAIANLAYTISVIPVVPSR